MQKGLRYLSRNTSKTSYEIHNKHNAALDSFHSKSSDVACVLSSAPFLVSAADNVCLCYGNGNEDGVAKRW
jgi:hypothetical protein